MPGIRNDLAGGWLIPKHILPPPNTKTQTSGTIGLLHAVGNNREALTFGACVDPQCVIMLDVGEKKCCR